MRSRAIAAVTLAALLAVLAVTPVAADGGWGYCNPGRASSPGTVNTFAQAAWQSDSSFIDDITASFRDADPFTEAVGGAGTSVRAYVSLRRDANNYFQFGVVKRSASTWRVFVRAERGGQFFYEEKTNAEVPISGGVLNGNGEFHSFRINRDAFGGWIRGRIDGGNAFFLYATSGNNIFEPNFAKVVYEIDNGGSEWWGKGPFEPMAMKDIHATRGVGIETIVPFDPVVNTTNKAHTNWIHFGPGDDTFTITDKDCE